MWQRAATMLACPRCRDALECRTIARLTRGSSRDEVAEGEAWIEDGVLTCAACRSFYPNPTAVCRSCEVAYRSSRPRYSGN